MDQSIAQLALRNSEDFNNVNLRIQGKDTEITLK